MNEKLKNAKFTIAGTHLKVLVYKNFELVATITAHKFNHLSRLPNSSNSLLKILKQHGIKYEVSEFYSSITYSNSTNNQKVLDQLIIVD